MSSPQKILKVKGLKKNFDNLAALKDVSFSLNKKDTKVIIGPSGSGKSTLLRCINLLVRADEGKILLEGKDITSSGVDSNQVRQDVGMVFQHFNLFTHLTALDNVSLGLKKVKGLSKEEANRRALEELEKVGIGDKANSYPANLSGGQQQRVGIARALAMDPKIILFDEPTSALDPELIDEVLSIMIKLAQQGMTMLVVTHEIGFMQSACDEIIFMDQGEIVEKNPPQKFFKQPENERTKQFLSKIAEIDW